MAVKVFLYIRCKSIVFIVAWCLFSLNGFDICALVVSTKKLIGAGDHGSSLYKRSLEPTIDFCSLPSFSAEHHVLCGRLLSFTNKSPNCCLHNFVCIIILYISHRM